MSAGPSRPRAADASAPPPSPACPVAVPPSAASSAAFAAPPAEAALWLLMGVLSMLFLLFGAAYLMRMSLPDWRPLPFAPWQLWLSSALLATSGAGWEAARRRATRPGGGAAGAPLAAACLASLAFLAAQLWAWQRMSTFNFPLAGNPANSFFYLLTGLHGLHVVGGLLVGVGACLVSLRGVDAAVAQGDATGPGTGLGTSPGPGHGHGHGHGHGKGGGSGGVGHAGGRAAVALRLRLCARYWHFLLVWWLLLFGLLFLLTPELARAICGAA